MADKRINALTTTASSTASDDFFAVDGTTNGTRKLNAYSPSFGGNATVTGTLTVNGATGSLGSSASAATSLKLTVGVGTNASPKYRTIDFRNYDDSKSQAYIRAANRETDSNASTIEVAARSSGDVLTSIATFSDSQLSIAATTASTSTSTGALVVGGGVGVAGAAYVGGNATVFGSAGVTINNIGGSGTDSTLTLAQSGVSNAFIKNTATTGDIAIGDGGGTYLRITKNAGVVSIFNTTASTSTSTGALVVSGGVGVAGAINAGGAITSNNGSGSGLLGMRSSSGNASYVFWSETGVADRGILGFNNGSSTLSYRSGASSFATGTEVFAITSGGNVTAGGSVQTAAPAGGTAAAWKLGTVASVSPTSPNRTIEVDIGGTIYYLHAKTTNN